METKKYTHPDKTNFYQGELSLEQAFKLENIFKAIPKLIEVLSKRSVDSIEFLSLLIEASKLYEFFQIVITNVDETPLSEDMIAKLKGFKHSMCVEVLNDFFILNPVNVTLYGSTVTAAAVLRAQQASKNMKDGADQNSPILDAEKNPPAAKKEPTVN